MEEKKETKLDLKSIGKAASSVKALSDSLKDCQEQMKQMKEGNVSAIEGILNIAVAAGGAYEYTDPLSLPRRIQLQGGK